MIVAVASGKGGTGKTTVAAALARTWTAPRIAVDFDVEAPNLHLFLAPVLEREDIATLVVPEVVPDACDACGACRDLCAFRAIALFGDFPVVFAELCHGCGGCIDICAAHALRPGTRELGQVLRGVTQEGIRFLMGRSRIGEAQSPPLMRRVRAALYDMLAQSPADVIVDAPPGTGCPAMEAVRDADLVLLVTEPTPFGLYDLRLAHQAFAKLNRAMAVVVNRAGRGDQGVHTYCREQGLPILAELPFDRAVAEHYARGGTLDTAGFEHLARIRSLGESVRAFPIGKETVDA